MRPMRPMSTRELGMRFRGALHLVLGLGAIGFGLYILTERPLLGITQGMGGTVFLMMWGAFYDERELNRALAREEP